VIFPSSHTLIENIESQIVKPSEHGTSNRLLKDVQHLH